MPSATVQVSGDATDLPLGDKTIGPVTLTVDPCVSSEVQVTLASGNNTISKPTGATTVIVVFPTTYTAAKTLKGVGADTGVALGTPPFVVFTLAAGATSFVIHSAAADTAPTTILFL